MVKAVFHPSFKKLFSKIKDKNTKGKIIKIFSKIQENPELGKPMKYAKKGTREVYATPYRLSYMYLKERNTIVFLDLYHKDEQ